MTGDSTGFADRIAAGVEPVAPNRSLGVQLATRYPSGELGFRQPLTDLNGSTLKPAPPRKPVPLRVDLVEAVDDAALLVIEACRLPR